MAKARLANVSLPEFGMPEARPEIPASLYPERGGSLLGDKAWSVVFDNAKIRRFVPEFRARTERDLQVASTGEGGRSEEFRTRVLVWTVKRRERRAPAALRRYPAD